MRIIFLGNGKNAHLILEYLLYSQNENIIGLVLHPKEEAKYRPSMEYNGKIICPVFEGDQINSKKIINKIKELSPDILISINFGYILKEEIMNIPKLGCINLHTSHLPFNRGTNPNVWSIIDGTLAGVTLHYIDKGIDTGDIIAQQKVKIISTDTGESLYEKLEKTGSALFQTTWPLIKHNKNLRIPQHANEETYHKLEDLEKLDEIYMYKKYKAKDLINIIRARTFSPHKGAYFIDDNEKKVYMRLQLMHEEDL